MLHCEWWWLERSDLILDTGVEGGVSAEQDVQSGSVRAQLCEGVGLKMVAGAEICWCIGKPKSGAGVSLWL